MTSLESLRRYLFENGWSHGPGNTWTNPRYSDCTTYCLAEAVLTQREHDRLAAEKPEPTKPAPMAPDILPPTKADMDIWNEVSAASAPEEKPLYKNNYAHWIFLGTLPHASLDLYACNTSSNLFLMACFGDNHEDHQTCVSTWDNRRTWFVEAKRRAIARGLCDADGKMLPKATDAEELFTDDSGLMLPLRSHFRGCKCQKCLPEATVPDELAERWQEFMRTLDVPVLAIVKAKLDDTVTYKQWFEVTDKFYELVSDFGSSFTEEEIDALILARSR